jgi:hypothetical protein
MNLLIFERKPKFSSFSVFDAHGGFKDFLHLEKGNKNKFKIL